LVCNRKGYVTVETRNHGDQQTSQGSISSASSEAEIWPKKREKLASCHITKLQHYDRVRPCSKLKRRHNNVTYSQKAVRRRRSFSNTFRIVFGCVFFNFVLQFISLKFATFCLLSQTLFVFVVHQSYGFQISSITIYCYN